MSKQLFVSLSRRFIDLEDAWIESVDAAGAYFFPLGGCKPMLVLQQLSW